MVLVRKASLVCFVALLSLSLFTGCGGVGNAGSGPEPAPTAAPLASPTPSLRSVNHIIFMIQENRSFDSYFGKINDYRASLGLGRDVDDIETDFTNPVDKVNPSDPPEFIRTFHLATSCIFNTSAAWLESHGNANRFDTSDTAPLLLDGFVHTAAGL